MPEPEPAGTAGAELRAAILAAVEHGERARQADSEVLARFEAEPTADYGRSMRRWLPDHDAVHDLVIALVRDLGGEAPRIVDLGAGTGRLSAMLLGALPGATIELIDYSANMLSAVPAVLSAHPGSWTVREADVFDPATDLGAGAIDVVVSSFALHHGRTETAYADVYRRVATALRPGGAFVCLDSVAGATPETSALAWLAWARRLRAHAHLPTVAGWIEATAREDSPLSLSAHERLLAGAGLSDFDVPWRSELFGLYIARRSAG